MGIQVQPCCCSGGDEPKPCDLCETGFAPRRIKLVVPPGTFAWAGDPLICVSPGACDIFAGTYLFDMLDSPVTRDCGPQPDGEVFRCCQWYLCFDGDEHDGANCECSLDPLPSDCRPFCKIFVRVEQTLPGDHFGLFVYFVSTLGSESPICGACDEASGYTIFCVDLGAEAPDCLHLDTVEVPVCAHTFAGNNTGSGCRAVPGASVFVTAL